MHELKGTQDLSPSQERAVRLALKCARLTKELDQAKDAVVHVELQLRKAMIQLDRLGVTLDLEDADRAERSA